MVDMQQAACGHGLGSPCAKNANPISDKSGTSRTHSSRPQRHRVRRPHSSSEDEFQRARLRLTNGSHLPARLSALRCNSPHLQMCPRFWAGERGASQDGSTKQSEMIRISRRAPLEKELFWQIVTYNALNPVGDARRNRMQGNSQDVLIDPN